MTTTSVAVVGTDTVVGDGVDNVLMISVVLVKVMVLVKVTGTVITDEAVVYVVYVTYTSSNDMLRGSND